ncbi:MAG TPA: hypothetical protein VFA75_18740 [Nevskia sp.]|nr:hypothetical protein [Nevskia sp.]
MSLNWKHAALALTALGAAAAPSLASAGHVSVGVGINLGPPGYYAPAPVYAAPPPVYTYDPPPVIYAPPPVMYGYGPPVPVYRPYYRRPHCWWEDGYRVCR